ncbi:MAG: hypothetical protein H0W08_09200 [Acidobacteria bacterium]|nr:hypothetical protein [Acidobacteriota bacterium]
MATITSALIRLYPRAWRQRYGEEMRDLLAMRRLSMRTLADLIAGAVDARVSRQPTPAERSGNTQGVDIMVKAFRCAPQGASVQDQWRSGAWLVGGSLVFTLVGIALQLRIGSNSFSEGLLYSAFPASLMLSSECTYLKRYSTSARTVMSIGGAVAIILMMWAAVAIGYAI